MIHARRRVDAVKLQREADELKVLAASVERQVRQVGRGEMPATLPKNLKRMAKLTHQLRLQLSN